MPGAVSHLAGTDGHSPIAIGEQAEAAEVTGAGVSDKSHPPVLQQSSDGLPGRREAAIAEGVFAVELDGAMVVDLQDDERDWDIFCQQQQLKQSEQLQPQRPPRQYAEQQGMHHQPQDRWDGPVPYRCHQQQQQEHEQHWQQQLQVQQTTAIGAAVMKLEKDPLLGGRTCSALTLWSDDDDDDGEPLCVEVLGQEDSAAACRTQLVETDAMGLLAAAEVLPPSSALAAGQQQGNQQDEEDDDEEQWEEAFAAADAAEAAAKAKRAARELTEGAVANGSTDILLSTASAPPLLATHTSPSTAEMRPLISASCQAKELAVVLPDAPGSLNFSEEPTGSCLLDLMLADELDDVTCQLVFDCAMDGEGVIFEAEGPDVDMQEADEHQEAFALGGHTTNNGLVKLTTNADAPTQHQQTDAATVTDIAAATAPAAAKAVPLLQAAASDPAAAAVAAARQKRRQLYQRFIRQALKGGRPGSKSGDSSSSTLQNLMKLIARVIKKRAEKNAKQLDLKGLLKEVQQELLSSLKERQQSAVASCIKDAGAQQHQKQCLQGQASSSKGGVPAAGCLAARLPDIGSCRDSSTATKCPATAMEDAPASQGTADVDVVPPQRLFVALLNLAHQNNLAVVSGAAASRARNDAPISSEKRQVKRRGGGPNGGAKLGTAVGTEGEGAAPSSSCTSGAGEDVAMEGPGGTCVAWLPETIICLAPGHDLQAGNEQAQVAHRSCNIFC
jgi:hypothetical protein